MLKFEVGDLYFISRVILNALFIQYYVLLKMGMLFA